MLPRLVSPRRGRVQWRSGGQTRTPVASGRGVFEVVGGGEGVDFEIAVGRECHGFGDSWSVRRKGDCPAVKSKGEKTASGEPCKARLTEREQVRCVWEFVSGGGDETETCEGAFERADMDWSRYYYPPFADENTGVDGEDDDSSGSNGSDNSSTGTGDSNGDSKEDVGVSYRPAISGLAFAVFGAVVVVMAL